MDCFFDFSFWSFTVSVQKFKRLFLFILYPATLPNSLMNSSSFLVASLWFSKYSIMSSAVTVLLFLQFWFHYLFILIAVARTSKIMLNRSGESGPPCLIPDLRGNTFSFCQWERCLLWVYHILSLSCLVWFPYTHFLERFYHKWILNLSKAFFFLLFRWSWFLSFILLIWYITLICVYWRILVFLR